MSGPYYGDFPTSAVVYMVFDTFAAATGAPTATSNFASGDVLIYKNVGTTQRTSANGITVTTSFDGNTGLQTVAIDTSDNTDAGFYAAGNEYQVAITPITADGQTMTFWLGTFSIQRAGGVLATLLARTPNAAAGASGGLLISGSNAGTTTLAALTVTGSMTVSDGLLVSRSSSNTSAATFTGNGTGSGIVATSGSGATGDGIRAVAASTNGAGMTMAHSGSGADLNATTTPLILAKTTNLTGLNDIAATAVVSAGAIITSGGKVSGVILADTVTTYTGNTPQTGDSFPRLPAALVGGRMDALVGAMAANTLTAAALAADAVTEIQSGLSTLDAAGVRSAIGLASANLDTQLGAIDAKTTNLPSDPADESLIIAATDAIMTRIGVAGVGLTNLGDARIANLDAAVSSRSTYAGGAVASVTAAVTLNGASPLTEAYAGKGAPLTLASALYGLTQQMGEQSIAGTTMTVLKRDQSTTAQTYTLDSATTPSAITQAT